MNCESNCLPYKTMFPQPQRSWLVRTTAVDRFPPLDPESQAMLSNIYKEWEKAKEEREMQNGIKGKEVEQKVSNKE